MNEMTLTDLHEIAYRYALSRTGIIEEAEDISSHAIYIYLRKREGIDQDLRKPWILATCRNLCHRFFDSEKHRRKLKDKIRTDVVTSLRQQLDENIANDLELSDAFELAKSSLSESELNTVQEFFVADCSIKTMAHQTGVSYMALRQRISRIKRKLRAETYKNLGMISSK